jgi:dienelactone hydrolase
MQRRKASDFPQQLLDLFHPYVAKVAPNHGFHNDTTPRYDEAAAKLAWQRSVASLISI